jgi:hypothetical protein
VPAEAKLTSKTDFSPGNRGRPLKSIAIELLVKKIALGSSWLLASFTAFLMPCGRPVNFSTNPLNPLAQGKRRYVAHVVPQAWVDIREEYTG